MNNPTSRFKPGNRLPPRDQLAMGLHAITELLRHSPKKILRVYTSVKMAGERKEGFYESVKNGKFLLFLLQKMRFPRKCVDPILINPLLRIFKAGLLDVKQFLKTVERKRARSRAHVRSNLRPPKFWRADPFCRVFWRRCGRLVQKLGIGLNTCLNKS